MKQSKERKILLFIDQNTNYFSANLDDFKKLVKVLSMKGPFEVEVIDIFDSPELVEEYRIEALPTLVIDGKKYIGRPTAEKAIEIFGENSI